MLLAVPIPLTLIPPLSLTLRPTSICWASQPRPTAPPNNFPANPSYNLLAPRCPPPRHSSCFSTSFPPPRVKPIARQVFSTTSLPPPNWLTPAASCIFTKQVATSHAMGNSSSEGGGTKPRACGGCRSYPRAAILLSQTMIKLSNMITTVISTWATACSQPTMLPQYQTCYRASMTHTTASYPYALISTSVKIQIN